MMGEGTSLAGQGSGGLSKEKTELLKLLFEEKSRSAQRIRPCPRTEEHGRVLLPVSWAQQRLWFIDQLEGGTAAYNTGEVLRLRGTLEPESLHRALDTLVRRHEVLRTVFVTVNGSPRQEICAEGRFSLRFVDLNGYEEVEREEQVHMHKVEEACGKFDLRTGPLIRGRLLRLRDDEHVLLIMMHHIISDGWSKGVLIGELAELYTCYREGLDNPLEPLPIQYADYAHWQRQWLREEELERQLSYWRAHLGGAAPELELPTDRPRRTARSYRGDNVPIGLDAQLSANVRILARRYEMTPFMVLCSAWAILLSRLSAQEDVVIGMPIANRQRPELERLIGFLVNTLALRIIVRSDMRVEELLRHVKDVTLGAYDHQDVPFERIVEAVQPQRHLSRNPLFQVMFAWQNRPRSKWQLSDLTATIEDGVYESSMFDLLLLLQDEGEEIAGRVDFASDLFDRATVERWLACYRTLLKGMTDDVQSHIGELPILTDRERHQILESFNATRVGYPPAKPIPQLFEEQVRRTPETIAVIHGARQLTYAELNRMSDRIAQRLRQEGVGPNQLAAICADRGLEMVVGVLGILKAGGAYLPLDPNYPTERLEYMLCDAAPRVVLTQEKLKALLPATHAKVMVLDASLDATGGADENDLVAADSGVTPQSLLYVIYTSGSTGRPKGVAMAHHSMANLLMWHRDNFDARPGLRVLQFAPLSFDVAFQETFSTLCTGGTLVLLDEAVRRDAPSLLKLLSSQSIERLFVPPLVLQSLSECLVTSAARPANLRDVVTAGEQLRISPEVVDFFTKLRGCRLHNQYGPTETHVVTALTMSGNPGEWPALPAIGTPVANTQIYILDAYRRPVPIGVTGEIYIGGEGVARGYLRRPDLTAERFISDPFSANLEARLYKTGDLGRWRADGVIEYLGRNDEQVKIRGYRIELGEIETQLARHEQVKECAVISREDIPGNKHLVAYMTLRNSTSPSVSELRAHLSAALPEYMIPSAFVVLESLPLTPTGKLSRRALPAPRREAYATRAYEAPAGETEQVLAGIWRDLLHVEQIGRDDNFFDLGGHSLFAVQVVARIQVAFSIDVPIRALFESPIVRRLAEHVNDLRRSQLLDTIANRGSGVDELLDRVAAMQESNVQHLLDELTTGEGGD